MITPDPTLFSFQIYGQTPILVTPWTFIGLIGNALFSARVLIQWIVSEKHKKSLAPPTFWWTSLAATVVMVMYSLQRAEFAFLLGYSINIVPYVRNLVLIYTPRRGWRILSYVVSVAVFVVSLAVFRQLGAPIVHTRWVYFGIVGVLVWNTRFLAQWAHAEAKRESALPLWFWLWSLTGQLLCLVYSLILHDLVFILGFLFNGIPIVRNIMLIRGGAGIVHGESHCISPPVRKGCEL